MRAAAGGTDDSVLQQVRACIDAQSRGRCRGARMRFRVILAVITLALALGACTKDTNHRSSIRLVDPGRCTPIDVAAAPEVVTVLKSVADQFNGSPGAHPAGARCS